MIGSALQATEADREAVERVETYESFEGIPSLDVHGDVVRAVLAEAAMLARKYRFVRRHDVPHIAELTGLLDVLWQEVRMAEAVEESLLH